MSPTLLLATAAPDVYEALVWVVGLGGIALIGMILYWLNRWEKQRYGGRRHPVVTRAGAGMLELQSLLEPSKRHVIEVRQQKKKDAGSGDGDDTDDRGNKD